MTTKASLFLRYIGRGNPLFLRQQTSHVFLGLRPKFLRPACPQMGVSDAPLPSHCSDGKYLTDYLLFCL